MTLTKTQIQCIIMYRGLGYTHREIADKIKSNRQTVQKYLHKFKKESKENGIDETFWSYFSVDSLAKAVYSRGRQEQNTR